MYLYDIYETTYPINMTKQKLLILLKIIAIPVAYALLLRLIFGITSWSELFTVMSITFLILLPTILGVLTIYFSDIELVKKLGYRLIMPWVPLFAFFLLTLVFTLEGWACWLMVMPLFMVSSSLGGLLGGYLKMRKKDGNTYLSILVLLPLFIAPIESMVGKIPGTYKAYTSIEIQAPTDKIWENVTRVKEISEEQDKGLLTKTLGFPRPLRAELNYNGVGAYREAIFTNGLVFHETVLAYEEKKKMVFTIKAYPYEIPSTTMDEHVVIGGEYFDVLNGTYELEQLSPQVYRLHLYSHFKMNTTFNFYASWWARWIMQDIQNNILQVVKTRAEKS